MEDIIAKFTSATPESDASRAKSDIENILKNSRYDIDIDFIKLFQPDIDPAGWGMTTRQVIMYFTKYLKHHSVAPPMLALVMGKIAQARPR